MFGLGVWELLIILAIVVLLVGANRLPKLASGLGATVRNVRAALAGGDDDATDR